MKIFFASLAAIFAIEASAQSFSPYKYLSLPHPPMSRSRLGPVSRAHLEFASQETKRLFAPLDSKEMCPRANELVQRVYKRVIEANHIDRFFFLENIDMQIIVLCPKGFDEIARAATGQLVISAPFISSNLTTEDELALLISHEISHVLQASDYKFLTNKLWYEKQVSLGEELKADENAVVMLANAGYDARTALRFVKKMPATMSTEQAMATNTHIAPALRAFNYGLYIDRHRLPSVAPTPFTFDIAINLAREVAP